MLQNIKGLWPVILSILIFVILACVYFAPQLQGKSIQQSDIIQFKGMSHELVQYRDQGDDILWTNSMFGGMPTYQIGAPQKGNLVKHIEKLSQLYFSRPIGYFLSAMLIFFAGLLLLKVDVFLAAIGAIAFAFTSNNVVLFEAGHTSKIRALIMGVLIIVGVIKVLKKEYLIGGITFGIGMALNVYANHFQMTYYLGIVVALLILSFLIHEIINKKPNIPFKSFGILLLGLILAIGSSGSKFWTTLEYGDSTMRGKPILESVDNGKTAISSSETEGLEWNYSMQWSNGFLDVMASYIPGIAGGGSSEPIAKNSATNKMLRRAGARPLEYGPMYWGALPFTSGPVYMGALSIFLFFLSLFYLKPYLRTWAILAVVLTFAMSMGKNIEWFNRFLFDYLPYLNKFRSPSSITGVTAIIIPFVGILGLNQLLKNNTEEKDQARNIKILIYTTLGFVALSLIYALLGSTIFDFSSPGDARYAQGGYDISAFETDRASIMRRDSFRSLFIVLAGAGLIWGVLKRKIKPWLLYLGLALITIFDLFGVDMRYLNNDSFVANKKIEQIYNERQVDKQIKQDPDIHYRVHDITRGGNPFENSWTAYHHKTIGGYHAAKLQRIQDIIDNYLSKGDQDMFNMLNTKYYITGEMGKEQAVKNTYALGNAWFVDEYEIVSSNRAEIEAIEGLDAKKKAIIHRDFEANIKSLNGQSSSAGSIKLKSYNPDKLVYQSNNSSDGLAVFSEVWYAPGWKLYVDGTETPLIRANYILRAAIIPSGSHEIVMEFHPKSYYTGEIISYIASILLLIWLAYVLYIKITNKKTLIE